MGLAGSGLLPLDGNPQGRKEPTGRVMTTHPTALPREDVFHHALHGLPGLTARLAQSTVDRLVPPIDRLLAGIGMVAMVTRCDP